MTCITCKFIIGLDCNSELKFAKCWFRLMLNIDNNFRKKAKQRERNANDVAKLLSFFASCKKDNP